MVEPDERKSNVLRVVVDVKETPPALESELAEFRSLCEELEVSNVVGGVTKAIPQTKCVIKQVNPCQGLTQISFAERGEEEEEEEIPGSWGNEHPEPISLDGMMDTEEGSIFTEDSYETETDGNLCLEDMK